MIREADKSEMDAEALMQATEVIIRAYGRAIEVSPVTPGCVADVRTLPYSKDKIKSALLVALKFTKDRSMRNQLKAGYLRLADYQKNVGSNYQMIESKVIDVSSDADAPSLTNAAEKPRSAVSWATVVREEKKKLRQELTDLGFYRYTKTGES